MTESSDADRLQEKAKDSADHTSAGERGGAESRRGEARRRVPRRSSPRGRAVEAPSPGRLPLRRMILRNTAGLPALVTLLNGIAGFASIYYATRHGLRGVSTSDVSIAAWLIFVAMAFDAIDGRLARVTRRATDFGAQLDSLCDVISFGVAPAVLMILTVSLTKQISDFDIFLPKAPALGKLVMAVAVLYVCCAVLRLARFNIENAPDLLSHICFKGLPSPAAAATVAGLVLLFGRLQVEEGWKAASWLNITVGAALPAVTFSVSLLMISRFRYPHLINQFISGRKSFGYIVRAVLVIVAALVFLHMALALATLVFAGSGPVRFLVTRARSRRRSASAAESR